MASSATATFLPPQAASFLRRTPESKTANHPSLSRWNTFLFSGTLLTKSPFFPIPVHAKFVRVRSGSSFSDAVEVAAEKKSPSLVSGGGLLTAPIPCVTLSASSSSHFASARLEAVLDNPLLAILMMGSATAVTMLARCFPVDPKLQVSMLCSLPRALDQIAENIETSFIEELNSSKTDYFTSQYCFRKHVSAPGVSNQMGRNFGIKWNHHICIPRKLYLQRHCLGNRRRHIVKAVATSTQQSVVPTEYDTKLLLGSDLHVKKVQNQPSNDETPEVDHRERLRRMRISKANKGNVPWNKGRKHSPETLQRIKERTRLAMQDPKVKMKLVNLGHAQSKETKIKIGAGVREGWRRRHEKLLLQEGCLFEWQNNIAESARKGHAGEDELQWDSYKTMDKQLKQEWLESIEARKTMSRPKGSRRAPKSPEQRRKISEAISAKWADKEYRARVCSALAKYHGTTVGVERRQKKTSGETHVNSKKKTTKFNSTSQEERSIKKVISKRRRNSTPVYKDPMASHKLEIIKKIREQRAAKEAKEATERAKLLIAEAEKAADALEMAALKSPLAQASLLETRKLIAEATRSIESIEIGTSTAQDLEVNNSLNSSGPLNDIQNSTGVPSTEMFSRKLVNGFHDFDLFPSSETNHKKLDSDMLTLQTAVDGWEPLTATQTTENSVELDLPLHTKSAQKGSETSAYITSQAVINNHSARADIRMSEGKSNVPFMTLSVKSKKKWVCGRLIEVEENKVLEEDSKQEDI
ncbi:hypothetical protein Cni_G23924 [Canna indica]|uniref:Nuclease associated modular domain-containing protein n=1 Tax=Canna indica TaxID=4628 RepID=A0AAQ3KY38_9LILI|nr:hypothetical protein Cni_G23924 [Canna indica]